MMNDKWYKGINVDQSYILAQQKVGESSEEISKVSLFRNPSADFITYLYIVTINNSLTDLADRLNRLRVTFIHEQEHHSDMTLES